MHKNKETKTMKKNKQNRYINKQKMKKVYGQASNLSLCAFLFNLWG